jgi:hypothetical protein
VIAVSSIDPQMQALSVDGVRRFTEASRLITAALQDAEQALADPRGQTQP